MNIAAPSFMTLSSRLAHTSTFGGLAPNCQAEQIASVMASFPSDASSCQHFSWTVAKQVHLPTKATETLKVRGGNVPTHLVQRVPGT
jgi:hypothetical protein